MQDITFARLRWFWLFPVLVILVDPTGSSAQNIKSPRIITVSISQDGKTVLTGQLIAKEKDTKAEIWEKLEGVQLKATQVLLPDPQDRTHSTLTGKVTIRLEEGTKELASADVSKLRVKGGQISPQLPMPTSWTIPAAEVTRTASIAGVSERSSGIFAFVVAVLAIIVLVVGGVYWFGRLSPPATEESWQPEDATTLSDEDDDDEDDEDEDDEDEDDDDEDEEGEDEKGPDLETLDKAETPDVPLEKSEEEQAEKGTAEKKDKENPKEKKKK